MKREKSKIQTQILKTLKRTRMRSWNTSLIIKLTYQLEDN